MKRIGTRVITDPVRGSFLHLLEKYASKPGRDPQYSGMFLVPKSNKKLVKLLEEAIEEAKKSGADTKWGGKVPKKLNVPLHDGDEDKDIEEYPEYEGMLYFNANAKKRKPGLVDSHGVEIFDEEAFKSGDYFKLDINFYPYSGEQNGIAVGLNNVMWWKEGEALGGGKVSAEKAFEGEFDDDDEDDDDDGMFD